MLNLVQYSNLVHAVKKVFNTVKNLCHKLKSVQYSEAIFSPSFANVTTVNQACGVKFTYYKITIILSHYEVGLDFRTIGPSQFDLSKASGFPWVELGGSRGQY